MLTYTRKRKENNIKTHYYRPTIKSNNSKLHCNIQKRSGANPTNIILLISFPVHHTRRLRHWLRHIIYDVYQNLNLSWILWHGRIIKFTNDTDDNPSLAIHRVTNATISFGTSAIHSYEEYANYYTYVCVYIYIYRICTYTTRIKYKELFYRDIALYASLLEKFASVLNWRNKL